MVSTVRENHSRPMTQTNLRRDQTAVLRTLFICSVGNEKDNIQPSNQKEECEGKASRDNGSHYQLVGYEPRTKIWDPHCGDISLNLLACSWALKICRILLKKFKIVQQWTLELEHPKQRKLSKFRFKVLAQIEGLPLQTQVGEVRKSLQQGYAVERSMVQTVSLRRHGKKRERREERGEKRRKRNYRLWKENNIDHVCLFCIFMCKLCLEYL